MHIRFVRRINADTDQCTIYCRLTVGGERAQFSTFVECPSDKWDAKQQKITGPKRQSENNILESVKHDLRRIGSEFILAGKDLSAKAIVETYQNKGQKTGILFSELAERAIIYFSKERDISEGTIRNWHVRKANVLNFFTETKRDKIMAEEVNMAIAHELHAHLVEKGLSTNYIARIMEVVKATLRYGEQMQIIEKNPLPHYTINRSNRRSPINALDTKEVQKLVKMQLPAPLSKVLDVFKFQIFTGISYAELLAFDKEKHLEQSHGITWIHMSRKKTHSSFQVPLLPQAAEIIERYEKLPVPKHVQTYNRDLRLIAARAGIEKHVTSHMGRKTFAMQMLNEYGISMETISKMLGHSDMRVTQGHYAEVNKQRIMHELEKLLK